MDRKLSKSTSTENAALLPVAEIHGSPSPRPRTSMSPIKSPLALSKSLSKRLAHQRAFRLMWLMGFGSVAFIFLQQSHVARMTVQNIVVVPNDAPPSLLLATNSNGGLSPLNSLSSSFPSGRATPLPALVPEPDSTAEADAARNRQKADGMGDPIHLGGALNYEAATQTLSPRVFELLRRDWGVRSLLDIGCGRGWSTLWFQLQGVSTKCVEASPTALKQSLLPDSSLVNHDFTRGPWWPEETMDIVWSTRFVQQVSKPYMNNYFAAMSKAAILLVSFPRTPGWHHVEVHNFEWWILQFELRGFRLHEGLTQQVKNAASSESLGPDGKPLKATGLLSDTKVFINPSVAALPAHAHLFPELGCYKREYVNGTIIHRECNTGAGENLETPLSGAFAPPEIDAEMHKSWVEVVKNQAKGGAKKVLLPSRANISHHAVMQIPDHLAKGNRTLPKIPVVVWPLWEFGIGNAEALHIEKNGIEESPLLQLSDDIYNFDPNVVWIGDTGYAYGWSKWCEKFNEHIVTAKARRAELGLQTSWPIYIVDWTDGATMQRCKDVEATVGKKFVFYTARSIVTHRWWDEEKGWVNEGRIMQLVTSSGIKYRHTPLIVRTDVMENLQSELRERGFKLRDKIEELDRPVDVTHLWPLNPSDPNSKVGDVESRLRTKVSHIVFDMGNKTDLNVHVGVAGKAAQEGRRGVNSAYIDALLSTKIVIVTQRDGWEDHYRLFEALISGSLVFADRMLSLPAGLKNGTSLIEFASEDQLRSLIEYYVKNTKERLAIAREGRRIAMMRHRTWHRIEEVIFGKALTVCSDNSTADCPYIVHANETSR